MKYLFKHTDHEDASAVLDEAPEVAGLYLHTSSDGAYLPREAALRLHSALGEWLFPVAPGTPDTTLLDAMVRKAAEDAVTAILPLHLKSMTLAGPECREHDDPSPHDVGHSEPDASSFAPLAKEYYRKALGFAPAPFDPEKMCGKVCPEDVHPASRCTWCGHLWVKHTTTATAPVPEPRCTCGHWSGWHGTDGCIGRLGTGCTCTWQGGVFPDVPEDHGRLMSELPRRVRPRGGFVPCTCDHARQVHGPLGCGYLGECTCQYIGEGP